MTADDRMVPLGTLPGLDFSTGTPVRIDDEAYRDYDTVLLPAVQLNLTGIRAARELLDDAERDILAYRFRLFTDDDDWTGWDIDLSKCRQSLDSLGIRYECDDIDELFGVDWLEAGRCFARADEAGAGGQHGELRALVALLRSGKTPQDGGHRQGEGMTALGKIPQRVKLAGGRFVPEYPDECEPHTPSPDGYDAYFAMTKTHIQRQCKSCGLWAVWDLRPGGVEIVHACPPDGAGVTPCCGKAPFELTPGDRITEDPALVTCEETAP